VVVHARQSVWVKVTADDKEVYQGRMTAGEVNAYTAEESIDLEAGNAAALEIVFNQMQLEPFSQVGQLLRLRFDVNGMQNLSATPVYQPSPTPDPNRRRHEVYPQHLSFDFTRLCQEPGGFPGPLELA